MTDDTQIKAIAWQRSWDRQQEGYLPDREQRFAAMLDTVYAVTAGRPVAILDLAGGTGSISQRALLRFPRATTTLVDIDPVLLSIARASLPVPGRPRTAAPRRCVRQRRPHARRRLADLVQTAW